MTKPEEELPVSPPSGDSHADRTEDALTHEQTKAVAKLEALGYQKVGRYDDDRLRFATRLPENKQARLIDAGVKHVQFIASNIEKYQEHRDYKGMASRDGTHVEFMIDSSSSFTPSGRIVEQHDWSYPEPDCEHVFNPWFIKVGKREYSTGFHVRSTKQNACMELSEISPILPFVIPTGATLWPSDYTEYTLKVWVNDSGDMVANEKLAQQIVHGLLFELDAKQNLTFTLLSQGRTRSISTQGEAPKAPQPISFPSLIIPREVAALFSFAGEAAENPPFAFLSYYQILEYYMPLVSRRDTLRRIRNEIRDLSFDVADDTSILRVLNTAERAKGLSEEEALKILVRDCARVDKLTDFLESSEVSQHFSRKGPIAGVPAINVKSTSETVSTQAARRIYALRNRIVHAKDDPRYAETPQLLPRSAEANALGPDIRLARFLALETVIDNQD